MPRCGAPDLAKTGRDGTSTGCERAGSPPSRLCANGRIRWCHSARACSTNSPVLPELSSHTSATARRCSSVACAAILARASCSEKPRCSINRFTRRSSSALTITTNGNIGAIPDSTRSGMSSTITGFFSACTALAINSDRRSATRGCTMPFSVWRFSSSLKAIVANAGRLSEPSSDRIRSPKASTSLASPSVPGSTTSREITSPSTTIPPSSLNVEDTVDFPAPIPPDRPMRNTAPVCQDAAEPNTPGSTPDSRFRV